MDTPENYYTMLGVPADADSDSIKRAYRQLARRFHPDLAGPESALQMKRINRAYAVLGDPEKREHYDTIMGGVVDLRRKGFMQAHKPHTPDNPEDVEYSGLNIFSTRGPFHAGPVIHSTLGVISALSSTRTVHSTIIAAGTLDGKGTSWQIRAGEVGNACAFTNDPSFTVESIRELRFSPAGSLLAGWHRFGLHIWDAFSGERLWSLPLDQRAVSAFYSLDIALQVQPDGKRIAHLVLPHLPEDVKAPRMRGVRSTDIASHIVGDTSVAELLDRTVAPEEHNENSRQFWAIRMRGLAQDARTLITLSCAQVANEPEQMSIIRRWDISNRRRPHITSSILVGLCADCTPPYTMTPDASLVAFVYKGQSIRLCNTQTGTYSEFASGTMGSSSRIALSPDAQWLAIAREDSEVNEGVIDLWSIVTGQVIQKFYHPWQISSLHFAENHLITALTDGTIQLWQY
jgi:WD40 repeat protein